MNMRTMGTIAAAGTAFLLAALPAEAADEKHGEAVHWTYQGKGGPTNWAELDDAFATCGTGQSQSPVSIPGGAATVSGSVTFDYAPTELNIVNNGHTVQVNTDKGSTLTIDGTPYELAQFHFHAPSENTVDGVAAAMEMHLVHVAANGSLAVVGVLFDFGEADNPFLASFWDVMPQPGQSLKLAASLNAIDAFDPAGEMVTFDGSLTTPPCSEGVKWHVFAAHETVSRDQVAKFVESVGFNARPTQPLNDRIAWR